MLNNHNLTSTLDRMLTLNRALDEAFAAGSSGPRASVWVPAMDIAERADGRQDRRASGPGRELGAQLARVLGIAAKQLGQRAHIGRRADGVATAARAQLANEVDQRGHPRRVFVDAVEDGEHEVLRDESPQYTAQPYFVCTPANYGICRPAPIQWCRRLISIN